MPAVKTCSCCGETKPVSEFYTRALKFGRGLRPDCKICHSANVKADRLANPTKYQEWARNWNRFNMDVRRANNRDSYHRRKELTQAMNGAHR